MTAAKHGNSDYNVILRVLSNVFIELRATENIRMANILSDVFHNAPAAIASNIPESEIRKDIYIKASRLECERQIDAMFKAVENSHARKL
ncbi:hypothetical protein [Rhizobium sp.]|uniref:hypothetical protein n=1 Tax=Rhizobium sp. TaxID=391 RepID=UPI0028975800